MSQRPLGTSDKRKDLAAMLEFTESEFKPKVSATVCLHWKRKVESRFVLSGLVRISGY